MVKVSGIYMWLNIQNGKVYVGQAADFNTRWTQHLSQLRRGTHGVTKSNPNIDHFQSSWNLCGESAFEFWVLEIIEFPEDFERNKINYREYLKPYEQKWIDWFRCSDREFGYNILPAAGSALGAKHTEEHNRKIGDKSRGRKHTEESKKKIRESKLGDKNYHFGKPAHPNQLIAVVESLTTTRCIALKEDRIYIIKSQRAFCKDMELHCGSFNEVLRKIRRRSIYGFTARYMTPEERED